jgi:hypothetical protein
MATVPPPIGPEPPQGAGQALEDQMAAAPIAENMATPDILNPQPAPEAVPAAAGTAAPVQAPGYQLRNPMLRLPPEVLFPSQRQKTPIQRQYDVGLLWQVLAQNSSDPILRNLAKSMTGKG